MKTTYIDVKSEEIKNILDGIIDKNPDSMLLLTPCHLKSGKAPTKENPNYVLTVNVLVSAEAVNDLRFITDCGLITVLRIPKNSVKKGLLEKEKDR